MREPTTQIGTTDDSKPRWCHAALGHAEQPGKMGFIHDETAAIERPRPIAVLDLAPLR